MTTNVYFRGASIEWASTFLDLSGNPTTPNTIKLYLAYTSASGPKTETLTMSLSGGEYVKVWDSAVASPGKLDWRVEGVNSDDTVAVDQGTITLGSNRADPNN